MLGLIFLTKVGLIPNPIDTYLLDCGQCEHLDACEHIDYIKQSCPVVNVLFASPRVNSMICIMKSILYGVSEVQIDIVSSELV